jgi:diketogulonate reductase-like aldo/keto reductase
MVDTAAAYLNEREVGAAIAASGVARPELLVRVMVGWLAVMSRPS